jgi:hypothetical protein
MVLPDHRLSWQLGTDGWAALMRLRSTHANFQAILAPNGRSRA